jgi:hypothetical protein
VCVCVCVCVVCVLLYESKLYSYVCWSQSILDYVTSILKLYLKQ